MASALFDKARESFLVGSINWASNDIKVALVSAAYTPNLATHQYLSDITGVVATSANLVSKTVTAGVADAADVTISAVTGATIVAAVVYADSGTASSSQLIAFIDNFTNLPLIPNGGYAILAWDNGANKIFKL